MRSVPTNKIMADILCQQDILSFLNNGGMIITRKPRKSKNKPVKALSSALSRGLATVISL
jgi:hypothetical protein